MFLELGNFQNPCVPARVDTRERRARRGRARRSARKESQARGAGAAAGDDTDSWERSVFQAYP